MASYAQTSFVGGMNMALDDSRIGQDEYHLGLNVRNRFGDLRPVKRPLAITTGFTADVPFQGVYSVGDFIILAQGGDAKFKHRLSDTWTTLWDASTNPTLRLEPSVKTIYFQAVPASNRGFAYKSVGTTSSVIIDTSLAQPTKTVSGIVVQDGFNQPNLIEFKSTTAGASVSVRKCYTFAQHGTDVDGDGGEDREYVPIGTLMMYFNGKLYIVNGSVIYHSVTGRPLDFLVAIDDETGTALSAVEADSGADAVSYTVSYDPVTCIAPLNTNSFFVGTHSASYAVTPIIEPLESLLFGEPTFAKKYLFGASAVNQFSFIDALGDFAFIDSEGLRSFNAVQQLRNEGRNSAFSLSVAKLFGSCTVQDKLLSAAISFDNYAFFAVKTIYGNAIVVYDTTTKKFVSVDTYQANVDSEAVESGGLATGGHDASGVSYGFGIIKQFTKIDTNDAHELYAITDAGEFLKLLSGAKYSPALVTTRAWSSGDPRVEQKPLELRTLFSNVNAWESKSIVLSSGDYYPNGSGAPAGGVYTVGTFVYDNNINCTAIPYSLTSGTEISFPGTNNSPPTGGIITLTADAAIGATTLSGTVASSGGVYYNASGNGYVRFTGAGTAKASMYANDSFSDIPGVVSKTMQAPSDVSSTFGIKYTDLYPLTWGADNTMQNLLFNFQQGRHGWKVGYSIQWDNAAYLSIVQTDTQELTPKNPLMTQAYGS
jgi:hypothetical protein